MEILNDILHQSFLRFLWGGSLVGILLGAGFLFKPQQVVKLNQYCSRWVNAEHLNTLLDRPRRIERVFYRHNRLFGLGVLLGATFVIYTFFFSYNLRTISILVPSQYWWLSDALIGTLLIGSVLAALFGSVVLIRPSLLRDLEASANRWISTDSLVSSCNSMHFAVEQSILRHHRIAGAAILLGSLYILIRLGNFLFRDSGLLI